MSDPVKELMVRFNRGVSEDDARRAAGAAGGKVRRRMRTDHDDEVMLLIKIDGDVSAAETKLKGLKDVSYVEANSGGFVPMGE